jgi:predicted XRE-type DNA-binding protein
MASRTSKSKAVLNRSDEFADSHANSDDALVKAQLVNKIVAVIDELGCSQCEAATRLGLPQPKLSKLIRGQFHGISARKLIECITRLGHDVEIVVRPATVSRKQGSVTVVCS